jgi:hypothetical protein
MTEVMSTTSGAQKRLRCGVRSKTGRPCWREATERAWDDDPNRVACAEHRRAFELGREVDELLDALDEMGQWIAAWDGREEDEGHLKRLAFRMRQKAVAELWPAIVRAGAAERIADQGPDAAPLSFEQAERHEERRLRSDALIDAYVILEDLQIVPEEVFGSGSRWQTAAALEAAATEASSEHARYRREIGR